MWLEEASAQDFDELLDSAALGTPEPEPIIRSMLIEEEMPEDYEFETKATVDTAVRREHRLVCDYASYMGRQGDSVDHHEICFGDGSIRLIVDMFNKTRNHLIEAKAHATRSDVRMAIGQLADYGRFTPDAHHAILLPEKPDDDLLVLLASQGIDAIWQDGPRFHDTAGGEFTTRRRGGRT
jgi:hypothetical protein